MNAIIIAAGPGTRMRPLTGDRPKCLLEIRGRPVLEHLTGLFRRCGIEDISLVRGYKGEMITAPGVTWFENPDFPSNNILHSAMRARPKLESSAAAGEPVILCYSDILFEGGVLEALIRSTAAISLVVDTEWLTRYEGRTDHPPGEAENVLLAAGNRVCRIAKGLHAECGPAGSHGEFIGLWKLTPSGIRAFLDHFDRVDRALGGRGPFQRAAEWRQAYVTDLFQEMIDQGVEIVAVPIRNRWLELDTVQDFERAGGVVATAAPE